jgi:2-desacetyl-2-hydroxyethyl bacteriochlorophyllide A dehydrogenase
MVRKIPDQMSFEEAALIEPATTTYAAVKDTGIGKGDRVLIAGGGVIGALSAQWCKYLGADFVAMTEINEHRSKKCLELGYADAIFDGKDPELLQKLGAASLGRGFKYFLECSGSAAALEAGMKVCGENALIAELGVMLRPVPVDFMTSLFRKFTIKFYLGYTLADFDKVMSLIAGGKFNVKSMVTGYCGLDDLDATYQKLLDPTCKDMKILLKFE